MRTAIRGMLFGGAICLAGIHPGTAQGEVTNEQFAFYAEVRDQFAWDGVSYNSHGDPLYTSTGVNDSFAEFGGFELVPFSRSGWGGTASDYPIPLQRYTITGDAYELGDGGVYARLSTFASPGYIFDFPSGTPDADAYMTFTLTAAMSFELTVHRFFYSNDFGSGSFGLREIGGDDVFRSGFSDQTNTTDIVAEGVLGPGEYRFWTGSFGSAYGDASLRIFVPAPASGLAFAAAGALARRRRR